ncbi:MAG: hypothetical protein ACJATF_002464 [Flavobacteriales bacterium]|jgi:hypothetical protein
MTMTMTMTVALIKEDKKFIGNGRSAKVYLSFRGDQGVATKTFTGEPVSKFILFVLKGSANPYTWNEDAIQAAVIRRRLLSHLTQFWFGNKVRLPKTFDYRWNETEKAYEIDTEFISGCHAPLLNPMVNDPFDYMADLRNEIMNPLESKLIESGFDGLVWQAGKGNPIGASNFMMNKRKDGSHQWIWIDLESGLPALFAMNLWSTLTYYLPMCVKHKGWLFDNVDTRTLGNYLKENKSALLNDSNPESYQQLVDDCEALDVAQSNWKGLSRSHKSLYYSASQDKITQEEASYYEDKPLRWFCKSIVMFLSSFVFSFGEKVKEVVDKIVDFKYGKLSRRAYRYFTDSRYRWGFVRWVLKREINSWHKRRSITNEERSLLLNQLSNDDISAYLTDFSIHLGLKPFVKLFTLGILPVLTAMGYIGLPMAAVLLLWTGPAVRTVYTLFQMVNNLVSKQKHNRYLALALGIIPIVGNIAYPAEFAYQTTGDRNQLAKYIAYALTTKIGGKIPIWGGQDSEIEHFFNRICHKLLS